jgi:hypothetical protein
MSYPHSFEFKYKANNEYFYRKLIIAMNIFSVITTLYIFTLKSSPLQSIAYFKILSEDSQIIIHVIYLT